MNAQAAYLLVTYRMNSLQAEAEHDRMAREAVTAQRSALRRLASNIRRRVASGADEALVPPPLPALSDYPYRS
jgi:hypothetical protein